MNKNTLFGLLIFLIGFSPLAGAQGEETAAPEAPLQEEVSSSPLETLKTNLAQETSIELEKIEVQILKETETHFMGTVKEAETPTGGAHFFAVFQEDLWNLVYIGNDKPECEVLKNEEFPETFLEDCKNTPVLEVGNAITIYNDDLALVKEIRNLEFSEGANEVSYQNVPKRIKPSTVYFEDLKNPSTRIIEQSYEYDLVSGDKLYEKFLDQEVTVTVQQGQDTREITGTLLSHSWGEIVLKTDRGIESIQKNNVVNTAFPNLPKGLLTKPTLVWTLWSDFAGARDVRTSYLTGGLSWESDYVGVVNDDDTQIALKGWTTINNRSGADFKDVNLKLVAGDVNVVQPPQPMYARNEMMAEDSMISSQALKMATGGFGQESFFEFHLYSLERKTDIKDNATKQIELFSAENIEVTKNYIYDPQKSRDKVRTEINFENKKENQLGMPLPKGTLRVYKKDASQAMQFIGEDNIKHTPKNEDIDIFLGNAFDITVEKKQTAYETSKNWVGFRECSFATQFVTLKNHKDEDVTVQVSEWAGGASAEIQKPTFDFFDTTDEKDENGKETKPTHSEEAEVRNEGDGEFVFDVPVKANTMTKVNYTVRSCR